MAAKSKSKQSDIHATQSTEEAFESILRKNYAYMLEWEPIAYKGEDIEGVHQVRVAYRRMRSALVIYRKAIPRTATDAIANEMRWAAGQMGPARDLDVFIDEGLQAMSSRIPLANGEKKMLELAIKHQKTAYTQVRRTISSARYKKFKSNFETWLDEKGWRNEGIPEKNLSLLDKGVTKYAVKVLNKRFTQVLTAGEAMDKMGDEELHQLRIDCKKLRYATEFFTPLFNKDGMANFTLHLKGLQGLLGVMNDVAVLPGLLEILLKDEEDPEVIQYAGSIIGWRARQYEEIRGQLDDRWSTFANSSFPWLRK
ncbi:MAG: CHAD domain-containing protein [Magnetococcales bacterium]|nr:CHAD domain-containing protein [Magnetococcales bacterium]